MSLTKRVRFEVFKRDAFTCQYCGKKAPDVILHVDHVHPRAEGGTDDLLNLITACEGCNLGKAAVPLSDDSAVTKQHAQLAVLQERQEQIAMMVDWQRSLLGQDKQTIEELVSFWCELADWYDVSDDGRNDLRKLLRKFGLEEVMTAMRIAAETYLKYSEDGTATDESAEHAFDKLGGICAVQRASATKPYLKDVFYIRGILRKRVSYVVDWKAKEWLESAFSWGADADTLRSIAVSVGSWTQWQRRMSEYIGQLQGDEPGDEAEESGA